MPQSIPYSIYSVVSPSYSGHEFFKCHLIDPQLRNGVFIVKVTDLAINISLATFLITVGMVLEYGYIWSLVGRCWRFYTAAVQLESEFGVERGSLLEGSK